MKVLKKDSEKKRGRPRATQAGELSAKDKLIETALKLFYRFGINSVGVDRVIEEADVAKMTFFKHFPTKRHLILEFLKIRDERFLQWFQATVAELVPKSESHLHAAISTVEIWFRNPDFRGCAFINTTVETGPEHNQEKEICSDHKKSFACILEDLAKLDGYKNPKEIADHLVLAIDGATIRAQMEGPERGIAALESIVKVLIEKK